MALSTHSGVVIGGTAERFEAALARTSRELLAARAPGGYWTGELSSSALSTATAVIALSIAAQTCDGQESQSTSFKAGDAKAGGPISSGLAWLAENMNADGGWGDTTRSISNISTTALCWAAFGAVRRAEADFSGVVRRAEDWLNAEIGKRFPVNATGQGAGVEPQSLAETIIARYGKDRTFSVPILTACALAGRLGPGREAWARVLPLPFELAALPHAWFAALRLPVVSYALPALIAIGLARHVHAPSLNPLARALRSLARPRTLNTLREIQPAGGGFLEATPLTSFVVMSLAGSGLVRHPVAERGLEFLVKSQRADGSWPIDTNLATWVTTLAVNALAEGQSVNSSSGGWDQSSKRMVKEWLLGQQHRTEHPYTHAAPGGWAWTDLPGGVPDADDTAGAVLALARLSAAADEKGEVETLDAAAAGIKWLLGLQNRDGGIPTFCRGWGALPFDRSSPDLTAHAIRAWLAWAERLAPDLRFSVEAATGRALRFLYCARRTDGSWVPLWFGNQRAPEDENPVYGTARVVRALCDGSGRFALADDLLAGGVNWLLRAQAEPAPTATGQRGWGGARDVAPSTEETALSVEALAAVLTLPGLPAGLAREPIAQAVAAGAAWLLARVESGEWQRPSPIGFYFAKLWYWEKLYPQIFTVAALRAAGATKT